MSERLKLSATTNEQDFRLYVVEVLSGMAVKVDALVAANDDKEERLRKVESRQWMLAGAASLLGVVVSQAINLWKLLK